MLVLDGSCLCYSVIGLIVPHVVNDLPCVAVNVVLLVLLCFLFRPLLPAASRMHQLVIEVVVVVLVKILVRHGEDLQELMNGFKWTDE